MIAILLVGSLLAPTLPAAATAYAADDSSVATLEDWSLDRDGNGLDDLLDRELADDQTGLRDVYLHYPEAPSEAQVDALLDQAPVERHYRFHALPSVKARVPTSSIPQLLDASGVAAVEAVRPAEPLLDTSVQTLRAREAPQASGGPLDHAKGVHEDLGFRGEGQVVAVIDTGVDNTHSWLDDQDDASETDDPKLVTKETPIGHELVGGVDTTNGFQPVGCVNPVGGFHGTHVAGIAVGTGDGGPHIGVAPQAKLVDVKISPAFASTGSAMDLALDWIVRFNDGDTCFGAPGEDRIDVATLSFTTSSRPDAMSSRLITEVARNGITFTVAAGNGGPDAGSLTSSAEGAVIVGSSRDRQTVQRGDDLLSEFSSRGPRTADTDQDDNDELVPHVVAPGSNITSALVGSLSGTVTTSGTSMATPHVAGLAALMLQANPDLRPEHRTSEAMARPDAVPVRDILIETTLYRTETTFRPPSVELTGWFNRTWNSAWGYGYVDAWDAAQAALAADTEDTSSSLAATGEMLTVDDRTSDGVAVIYAEQHLFDQVRVRVAVTNDTGAAVPGASVTGQVVYQSAEGSERGIPGDERTSETDEDGIVVFAFDQDGMASAGRGESFFSAPGPHVVDVEVTPPPDRPEAAPASLEIPYIVETAFSPIPTGNG